MATPRYLTRPAADPADADPAVVIPYGMTSSGIVAAINDLYAYLSALNTASITHGYDRLEDIMLPAGFSGLISELMVRMTARHNSTGVPGVARNMRSGGRPDLVPRAVYAGDSVHRGDKGIEVKASTSNSSWQGHNRETGWIMIIQLAVDRTTMPIYDRQPTCIERVLIAELTEDDWVFSGRSATSRRTPTASINPKGRAKLAAGVVYRRGRSAEGPPPVAVP
jgi:hypothetical protein